MTEGSKQTGGGSGLKGLEIRSWWGRILVGRRPLRTFIRLIVVVAVLLGVTRWCFVPIRVTGNSMEPTYRNGRINVLNLLAYHRREPDRGQVVGVQLHGRRMILLKRILGLPGERVWLRDGIVRINGTALREPYARGHGIPSMAKEIELGGKEYFIIGDNRDVSECGIVELDEIKGKALF